MFYYTKTCFIIWQLGLKYLAENTPTRSTKLILSENGGNRYRKVFIIFLGLFGANIDLKITKYRNPNI